MKMYSDTANRRPWICLKTVIGPKFRNFFGVASEDLSLLYVTYRKISKLSVSLYSIAKILT